MKEMVKRKLLRFCDKYQNLIFWPSHIYSDESQKEGITATESNRHAHDEKI